MSGHLLIGVTLVIGVFVATLAVAITQEDTPPDEDHEDHGLETIKLHPNHSDLCSIFKEALFETDCDGCQPNVGIDGDTVVIEKGHEYVQFLSIVNGELDIVSTLDINYALWVVTISGNMAVVGGGN